MVSGAYELGLDTPVPAVSVLIPAYNHARYITETLKSVFDQSCKSFEVVVVNDGSTDSTSEVLEPWVRTGQIRVIHQANSGQSAARNRGLAEARGKYVAFLDDDDYWPADKLSWQTQYLEEHPTVVAVSGVAQTVDFSGKEILKQDVQPEVTLESLFRGNPFLSPGQLLVRHSALREVGGMNSSIWGTDDWDLWMRLARQGKIVMADKVSLYYRVHSGNASRHTGRMLKGSCETIRANVNALSDAARSELEMYAYRLIFHSLARQLVDAARQQFIRGHALKALSLLREISPIGWNRVIADPVIRNDFASALLLEPLRRKLDRLFTRTAPGI